MPVPVRMVKELQGGFSGHETVQRRTDTQLAALLEGLQVMVKETVSESMQHAMSGSLCSGRRRRGAGTTASRLAVRRPLRRTGSAPPTTSS